MAFLNTGIISGTLTAVLEDTCYCHLLNTGCSESYEKLYR